MHLMIDGRSKGIITEDIAVRLIHEITSMIKMRLIGGPWSIDYAGQPPGVSAVAIFAESSITVHAFSGSLVVNVDVFSCKNFDVPKVVGIVASRLGIADPKCRALERLI